jgi:hypothetical protein
MSPFHFASPRRPPRALAPQRRPQAWRGLLLLWALLATLAPMAALVHGVLHAPGGAAWQLAGHAGHAPHRDGASSLQPAHQVGHGLLTDSREAAGGLHEAGSDDCRLWDQLLSASPLQCTSATPALLPQPLGDWRGTGRAHVPARPYSQARARGPPANA